MSVIGALLYAVANVLHPSMLWLMLWPMLVALAFWLSVAFFFWMRAAFWLAELLRGWFGPAAGFVGLDLADAALIAAHVALFLLFVPLVYITALFILGVFGMQRMVDHVAGRSFPQLARRRGGGPVGSALNGMTALAGMTAMFIVSLPLWLLPPLWPLIPLAIFTWGNQRLLRYDALAEHAEPAEMQRIFRERRRDLYALGLLLALLAYVPLIGLIAPVIFGLAFIRYLLGALHELRSAPRTGLGSARH